MSESKPIAQSFADLREALNHTDTQEDIIKSRWLSSRLSALGKPEPHTATSEADVDRVATYLEEIEEVVRRAGYHLDKTWVRLYTSATDPDFLHGLDRGLRSHGLAFDELHTEVILKGKTPKGKVLEAFVALLGASKGLRSVTVDVDHSQGRVVAFRIITRGYLGLDDTHYLTIDEDFGVSE